MSSQIKPAPAVGSELRSFSPSQGKTFRLCARRHWLEKRCKLPVPQHPSAELGEKVHGVAETHYTDGSPIDPTTAPPELQTPLKSLLLLQKDPNCPRYRPGLLIETPRNRNMGMKAGPPTAGVSVWGRIDLVDPAHPDRPGLTKCVDWKSSRHTKFRPTAEQLVFDLQNIVYTKWIFDRVPNTEAVTFAHGNINTDEVEAKWVETDPVDRPTALTRYDEVVTPLVLDIREHYAINEFDKTTPNYDACNAYGGCPFRNICGTETKRAGSMEDTDDAAVGTYKERLAAKGKGPRATGINPPDAAKPVPEIGRAHV